MNKWIRTTLTVLCLLALMTGCMKKRCASEYSSSFITSGIQAPASLNTRMQQADRMLVWKAYLTLEVWNVSNAVTQAIAIAEENGGYVEQTSSGSESYASLQLRIPSAAFTDAVGEAEGLGSIVSRSVNNEDVTEQYVDIDARLKNKIVLRDRLRDLLDKATEVKDILAIETELNRVQGDIDSMEARIKALKGQVDFASLNITFQRKQVLGPLGWVVKGTGWAIYKLFVIRD